MEYNGKQWQVDQTSQIRIGIRNMYAQANIANPGANPWSNLYSDWRNVGNEDIGFATARAFQVFAKKVSDHCNSLYTVATTHKDNIRSLDSFEALENYDITLEWE